MDLVRSLCGYSSRRFYSASRSFLSSNFQIIRNDLIQMRRIFKPIIIVSCFLIGAMWIYESWKANAEQICAVSEKERLSLIDLRKVKDSGDNALAERAQIIDKATDSLERAVNSLAALSVSDSKGQALVPLWLSDYRTHIQDRREYADDLRTGVNEPFSETVTEGLPISEKIATFAADNAAPSCAPPIDLSV